MRLLVLTNHGEFSLTKDLIDNTPPYAILSHTWGEDDDEVTFKDLIEGSGKSKAGYRKIQFCGEQAARDGLQYFWVDTCCIDKSNNTELSEAINSMFGWYRKAAKCYVYLSDVSVNDYNQFTQSFQWTWEPAFRKSRWFTRGWTLQELIAPLSVEFFSLERKQLGCRKSLERQIHEITGIPVQALQGSSLSNFSVKERMSWVGKRETKREEDGAYCLLGIFDIHMLPIYGEGKKNAITRLREEIDRRSKNGVHPGTDSPLKRLPFAAEAPFNSYARQHEPTCLPNTRVDVLQEIFNWADGQDKRCIFWLNGLAGTGKSTIARTVARRYFEQGRLGASFFFSRGGGDVSHAGKFVTSIAVQFAENVPALYQHIYGAIAERSDIASQSLRDQWHQLVLRPLSKQDGNGCQSSYVLVVDALDECDDDNNIGIIVQLLAEARSLEMVRLRVFLTSRPEIPIRYGFCQIPDAEHQDFVLHNISPAIIDHDIYLFLEYNLRLIGQERCLDVGWPGKEIIMRLVWNAGGLFIWAATACRFIREGKRFAAKRLDTIIHGSSNATTAPEKHLNEIYVTVLKHSIYTDYTDEEREDQYRTLRHTLGSVVVLFSPISAHSLSRLLHVVKEDVGQTLEDLHAILDIPADQSRPLRLHHPSFRDFLLDKDRCGDPNFWVDEKQAHQRLAEGCIRLMSASLKQDICGQNAPGVLVTNVESTRVEQCLSPELQYACLYWIQHLQKSGAQLCDNDKVHQFLKVHLLHWLEALSWMRKVSKGIYAINSLESIARTSDCPDLSAFIHDIKRFALYGRSAIEQAPLQVYCSALIFAPMISIVKKQFIDQVPRWVKRPPKVEKDWNALLQTLEGHSGSVNTVAFSRDGKVLASASADRTVKLWDASTGAVLQILEGHSGSVNAVAFSRDDKVLASASDGRTVKLWDVGTGVVLQTLEGHLDSVRAVAFSQNGKVLVSASADKTVKLWDASTGAVLQTLDGHLGSVNAVAFSRDGKVLASASADTTVKLWDAGTGAALQALKGHSSSVCAVAFSRGGRVLASGSADKTVKLWDASTGAVLQTLKGHSDYVHAVAFSRYDEVLTSASADTTVGLWDASTGVVLQTLLKGHWSSVNAVAFSRDGKVLASASADKTVKLWDTSTGAARQTSKGHLDYVRAVAFSRDGKVLVSASADKTVKLWDASTGAVLKTLKGHSGSVNAVAFSRDGKVLASASADTTVRLWGVVRRKPRDRSNYVHAVAFSRDGKVLFSRDQTLNGHLGSVHAVAFSQDGKVLASTSDDMTVKLWDASTGAVLQTLKGHLDYVRAVAFSQDSKVLASASADRTVKLWDARDGKVLQTLRGHLSSVRAVAFSRDGKVLASASADTTVKLWDVSTGAVLQMLKVDAVIQALSFSNDGTYLQTDRGVLYTTSRSPSDVLSRTSPLHGIFVKEQWVYWGLEGMLWLPPEYRPSCTTVYGSVVALGHSSGRVLILEFAF